MFETFRFSCRACTTFSWERFITWSINSSTPRGTRPTIYHAAAVDTRTLVALAATAVETRKSKKRSCWDFHLFDEPPPYRRPGTVPFDAPRSPRLALRPVSSADRALCCHVGRAWRGRGGSGGARESRRFAGHTKTEVVLKMQNGTALIIVLLNLGMFAKFCG